MNRSLVGSTLLINTSVRCRLTAAACPGLGPARTIEFRDQAAKIAQPTASSGVAEALVLREDVDEALTDVVAVVEEEAPPLGTVLKNLQDRAFRPKLRHLVVGSVSSSAETRSQTTMFSRPAIQH
jgi:hypothetical protein